MADAYDVSNVVTFLGGFGKKRAEIATANQADKDYKLKTIETMFSMAEGIRAQAEASAESAEDTSLSTDARARHRAAAEKSLQEGSRIYEGASELFGMIDDKPKAAGKKENPAMQFLKFVNPFTRRGPESGEFEERLQELMVGLGGKGMSAADLIGASGGEAGGGGADVGAGLGKLPTSGQGTPSPTPGEGTPGQLLAAQGGVVRQREAEPLIPGTIFPTSARDQIQPPVFAGAAAATGPPEEFPYINLGRYAPQFGAMPSDEYWNGVALEVKKALTGLNAIQAKTPKFTETWDDMVNNPEAWNLYITAQTGSANHPDLESDDLAQGLSMIFPDLRKDRPDAGDALVRQFEADLRRVELEDPKSLLGPMKGWDPALQKSAARLHAFYAVTSDKPEVQAGKLALDAWMTDPDTRTKQQQLNIDAYLNARIKAGMGGGAGGTAGATERFSGRSVRDPETGQLVVGKFSNVTGNIEISRGPDGQPFFTGSADIARWQARTPVDLYPTDADIAAGITEMRQVYPMLPWVVMSDISDGKIDRPKLRALMTMEMFDFPRGVKAQIEKFLTDNPGVGGPESPEYLDKQRLQQGDRQIRGDNPFLFPTR